MKKSFVILLNIAYWFMYLLLLSIFLGFVSAGAKTGIISKQQIVFSFIKLMSVITIIPGLISFYSFYHFVFNKFLTNQKIGAAVLYGLVIVFGCGIIGLIGLNIAADRPGSLLSHSSLMEIITLISFMSLLCLVHGIIALIIKGFIVWYGDIRVKEELKQKNFETELALIKLQLEPHFLFNTINNIDVLIEKDAAKASLYLNKLSDIMRFMLYETKAEHVPLEKELAYIAKYIDLQKIRNANANYVQYETEGYPGNILIAPMLFIPFIENAFKHSANKKKENAISIRITIQKNIIHFHCSNFMEENPFSASEAGGLGNELMCKRLELLYPGKHKLEIKKEGGKYIIELTVDTLVKKDQ